LVRLRAHMSLPPFLYRSVTCNLTQPSQVIHLCAAKIRIGPASLQFQQIEAPTNVQIIDFNGIRLVRFAKLRFPDFHIASPNGYWRNTPSAVDAELCKNSLPGTGTLILKGSLPLKICTRASGDFNHVLTLRPVQSEV